MANIKAKELVSTNPVVVFSKTYCPFCASVKKVSNQLGATYKAVELDVESDGSDIQAALAKSTGQRTVPNVFIGGNHIGGCDITTGMHKKGKLIPLLTLPFLNYIPVSAFSSSSLQTISNSKSLSNPLYHFLPDSQNPNNLVNLIYASLKQEKGEWLWGFDAVALHQPVEDKTELQEMLPSDPTKRLSLTWYLEDGDLATAEEV